MNKCAKIIIISKSKFIQSTKRFKTGFENLNDWLNLFLMLLIILCLLFFFGFDVF